VRKYSGKIKTNNGVFKVLSIEKLVNDFNFFDFMCEYETPDGIKKGKFRAGEVFFTNDEEPEIYSNEATHKDGQFLFKK
jgi:hypothetical protein